MAGWLSAEDANKLGRTCLGMYAVVMQYEQSTQQGSPQAWPRCVRGTSRLGNWFRSAGRDSRTLEAMRSMPLCRVAMDRRVSYAIVEQYSGSRHTTIRKWPLFERLLAY